MTITKKTWKKIAAGAALVAALAGAGAAIVTQSTPNQTTEDIVLRPIGARTSAEFGKDSK